jgi:hypothetical protein
MYPTDKMMPPSDEVTFWRNRALAKSTFAAPALAPSSMRCEKCNAVVRPTMSACIACGAITKAHGAAGVAELEKRGRIAKAQHDGNRGIGTPDPDRKRELGEVEIDLGTEQRRIRVSYDPRGGTLNLHGVMVPDQ